MSPRIRFLMRVLFLGLTALLLAGCGLNAVAVVSLPAPVKLGLAASVAGPDHAAGNRLHQAVQLAVERRNARGGIAGRPVELVVHDDHTPNGGAVAARRLAFDPGVLAALGHADRLSAEAAAPVYREVGLPAALLGDVGASSVPSSSVLRLAASPEANVRAAAAFAVSTLRATTVAVVAGPDQDDTRTAVALGQAAQAAGLRVVRTEELFPGSTNYTDAVRRLAAARPDVLLIAARLPTAAAFWRAASSSAAAAIVIGVPAGSAPEFAGMTGDAGRTAWLPTEQLETGGRPDLQDVVAAYRERWGALPTSPQLLAYDAADLLLEAMDGALRRNPRATRDAVRDELRGLREFGGVTGRLRFDESGGIADVGVSFRVAVP